MKNGYVEPLGRNSREAGVGISQNQKGVRLQLHHQFIRAIDNISDRRAQIIPYLRKRMAEAGGWNSLSRYLLQFGGSPKGVLGEAMKKGKPVYVYYVWDLLNEASKVLPAGEVAELCREVLDAKWIRSQGREAGMAELALPWTIEQLKAGKPFPEWDEWNKMRP